MEDPSSPDQTPLEEARARYEQQKQILWEKVDRGVDGSTQERLAFARDGFNSAAVELIMNGLEEWIRAQAKASKDREASEALERERWKRQDAAAEEERKKVEADRLDQKRARWVMIALTVIIGIATAFSAVGVFRPIPPPVPIVLPAVPAPPAPVVNVAAPPPLAIPAPVVNVYPVLKFPPKAKKTP